MKWQVIDRGILLNSLPFFIKGVSYFGFEDCGHVIHGLNHHPLTWYMDFLSQHQFNVVRLPFSQDWVNDDNSFYNFVPSPYMVTADPSLTGLTSLQIMHRVFDEATSRGIYILPDMHRLHCNAQDHETWKLGDQFTNETFITSWQRILQQFSNKPSFMGIDLLNEPRGSATWSNDTDTSWNLFVDWAIGELDIKDHLIFVEGIEWGKSFDGMRDHPINSTVVYSPHVYGPSVTGEHIPKHLLHGVWDKKFGYLVDQNKTVVVGEFGRFYIDSDKEYQDYLVDYLVSKKIPGIFWALGGDSDDTHGLLSRDDWTSPNHEKLQLLRRLQPTPSRRYLRRLHHVDVS